MQWLNDLWPWIFRVSFQLARILLIIAILAAAIYVTIYFVRGGYEFMMKLIGAAEEMAAG